MNSEQTTVVLREKDIFSEMMGNEIMADPVSLAEALANERASLARALAGESVSAEEIANIAGAIQAARDRDVFAEEVRRGLVRRQQETQVAGLRSVQQSHHAAQSRFTASLAEKAIALDKNLEDARGSLVALLAEAQMAADARSAAREYNSGLAAAAAGNPALAALAPCEMPKAQLIPPGVGLSNLEVSLTATESLPNGTFRVPINRSALALISSWLMQCPAGLRDAG